MLKIGHAGAQNGEAHAGKYAAARRVKAEEWPK